MIILGIVLFLIGSIIHRFLNRPEPNKPNIAYYSIVKAIPTLLILTGIVLFLIGLIKGL